MFDLSLLIENVLSFLEIRFRNHIEGQSLSQEGYRK
jgi:hypothetical protein